MSEFNLLCAGIVYIFFVIIFLIEIVFEDYFFPGKKFAIELICCVLWPLAVAMALLDYLFRVVSWCWLYLKKIGR